MVNPFRHLTDEEIKSIWESGYERGELNQLNQMSKHEKSLFKRESNRRWKIYVEETESLEGEIPTTTIQLYEHCLPSTGKRKTSSFWTSSLERTPKEVEDAATDLYREQGYTVSRSIQRTFSKFRNAELVGLSNDDQSSMEELFDRLIPRDWRNKDIENLIRSDVHCTRQEFKLGLEKWFEWELDFFLNYEEVDETRLNPSLLGGLHPTLVLTGEEFSTVEERETFLKQCFYNFYIVGATSLSEVVEALMNLYDVLPKNLFQLACVMDSEREGTAGYPDLLIWNDQHYNMVEVKSPNDSLVFTQLKFFRQVVKPLNLNMTVARVKPIR